MKKPNKIASFSAPVRSLFNIVTESAVLFMSMCIASMNLAHADDTGNDKFRIALGGYSVSRYDSTMSLTGKNVGLGASISPGDTLDLNTEQTVLRLDGHYRFNKEHALTFSWYSINSTGYKSLLEEISWVDKNGDTITIPIGANVGSTLDYDIYKIGYLWSFYSSDKVELAAGAGLHITRVAIGLTANTTSSGIDAQDVATTVPLPVLSFGLTYHVTPKFQWYLKSEFFAMEFNEWNGIYSDSTLGMEYRAFDHVGIGLGIGSNSLKLIEETNDYKFTYDNRITGIYLYVAGYF